MENISLYETTSQNIPDFTADFHMKIPTRKGFLIKSIDGKESASWLCTSNEHAENIIKEFYEKNDVFVKNGTPIKTMW